MPELEINYLLFTVIYCLLLLPADTAGGSGEIALEKNFPDGGRSKPRQALHRKIA